MRQVTLNSINVQASQQHNTFLLVLIILNTAKKSTAIDLTYKHLHTVNTGERLYLERSCTWQVQLSQTVSTVQL